jgi:isocitrate lyase
MSNADAEDAQYQQEVEEVKKWWTDSRWRYTRRTFTAEEIVAKRGNLKITYPSNNQSKKLWNIVEDRFKVRHPALPFLHLANIWQNKDVSFTYGCLDPVMVTQMAKYLDTVYVSGWQASSTASSTDEPGPDLADYPYVSPYTSESCFKSDGQRPPCRIKLAISSWHSSSTIESNEKSA